MPAQLGRLAKQRRYLTEGAATTEGCRQVLPVWQANWLLLRPPQNVWHQDNENGLWRGFSVGLMLAGEASFQKSLRPVLEVSVESRKIDNSLT